MRTTAAALAIAAVLWVVPPVAAAPVPSPYTRFDACDSPLPPEDISYLQVRNASPRVELRWAQRICSHPTSPDEGNRSLYFVRFNLDLTANGPGVDYRVYVYDSAHGTAAYTTVVHERGGSDTCINQSYRDLGPSLVGDVSSIRFGVDCIGGLQPFRVRLFSYLGDEVPDDRLTPPVLPRDP